MSSICTTLDSAGRCLVSPLSLWSAPLQVRLCVLPHESNAVRALVLHAMYTSWHNLFGRLSDVRGSMGTACLNMSSLSERSVVHVLREVSALFIHTERCRCSTSIDTQRIIAMADSELLMVPKRQAMDLGLRTAFTTPKPTDNSIISYRQSLTPNHTRSRGELTFSTDLH